MYLLFIRGAARPPGRAPHDGARAGAGALLQGPAT